MLYPHRELPYFPVQTLHSADEPLGYLQLLESLVFTSDTLRPRLGEISNEQVEEISYCIQQGRELFVTARTSKALTMPVTLYYGTINFAKAIILSRTAGLRLRDIPGRHGLVANQRDINSIEDFHCQLHERGVFLSLNDAIRDKSVALLREGYKGRICTYTTSDSPSLRGVQFRLIDLLSRLPELRMKYFITYNQRPHSYRGSAFFYPNGNQIRYDIGGSSELIPLDQVQLHADFTVLRERAVTVLASDTRNPYAVVDVNETSEGAYPLLPQYVAQTGQPYFVGEIQGKALHELSVYFMGLYLLSMVARYRPELWGKMLARKDGQLSLAVSLVEDFMVTAISKVPRLVLTTLSDVFHDFGEMLLTWFRSEVR